MKTRFRVFAAILFLSGINTLAYGQLTDAEKALRTASVDTIQGWKKGGVINVNLAQTSLTNWAAGGQNSFAVNGLLSTFANYKMNKTAWANSLDIGYGVLNQGGIRVQEN